jgi:hypothetical protein
VSTVRARQKTIARLKKQIRPTRRARVMLYLRRLHAHSAYADLITQASLDPIKSCNPVLTKATPHDGF